MIEKMLEDRGIASRDDYSMINPDTSIQIYSDNNAEKITFDYNAGCEPVLMPAYSDNNTENITFDYNNDVSATSNEDELMRLTDFDELGELEAIYEDEELGRPFSDEYNNETLDIIAMRNIARGSYNRYGEEDPVGEMYDPDYDDDSNIAMNSYFNLEEDEPAESIVKYERTQETRKEMFKKIIEMFRKSEQNSADDDEQEETPTDKILRFELEPEDEDSLEYRLVA